MRRCDQRFSALGGDARIWFGLETRRGGDDYRWDGLKRAYRRSEVIFQCTLAGEGCFTEGGREWALPPGSAFFAQIPSAHVYWMPEQGEWTFFWFIIEHPYVVERLQALHQQAGAVRRYPEESPALLASVELFRATAEGRFASALDQEEALFRWLFAQERAAETQEPRARERERLLRETASAVRDNLTRPLSVEELAAGYGMSRSHFSHHFRRVTGVSPAAHMTETRLAEALRLMGDPALNIADIAARTGFADANHFGKVFRRRWGVSPGAFRRSRLG